MRMPQRGHMRERWNDVLEQLQPLGRQLRSEKGGAGDIAARPGQAVDQSVGNGVAHSDHNNRDSARRLLGRQRRRCGECDDYIHSGAGQLGGQLVKTLRSPFRITALEDQVAAFRVAKLMQPLDEGV
jgi:hypothetical protein